MGGKLREDTIGGRDALPQPDQVEQNPGTWIIY